MIVLIIELAPRSQRFFTNYDIKAVLGLSRGKDGASAPPTIIIFILLYKFILNPSSLSSNFCLLSFLLSLLSKTSIHNVLISYLCMLEFVTYVVL